MQSQYLTEWPPRVKVESTAAYLARKGYTVKVVAQGSVFKASVKAPSPVSCLAERSPDIQTDLFAEKQPKAKSSSRGGKRGTVDGLSRGSRRRFMEKVKRIDSKRLPLFMTLTLPNVVDCFESRFPKQLEMKAILEKFRKRMTRKFVKFAAFWRMEVQDKRYAKILAGVRTSQGNIESGVPYHFHLLAWGLESNSLKYVQRTVARIWQKVLKASALARTEVVPIKSFHGVTSYASKYLCKAVPKVADSPMTSLSLPHITPCEKLGRVWGMLNKGALPWAELFEHIESFGQWFFRMRRSARKVWNFKTSNVQGFTLFRESAEQWFDYGLQLSGGKVCIS